MPSPVRSSKRVVVVGGGIAGLATATRLAQSGYAVTVLERGRLGSGASTKNQGWLHSGAAYAIAQPDIARLCHESLRMTLAFCPECLEPGHDGALFLLPEETADDWTQAWTRIGLPHAPIPPTQVLRRVPFLATPAIQHAFLMPDRSIRVDVLLKGLANAASHAGAELRPETDVTRLIRVRDEIRGVVTNYGEEITAQLVILAANARNAVLLPELVASGDRRFTLTALKTHLVATAAGPSAWPVFLPDEDGFHYLPHPPGAVLGSWRWRLANGPDDDQPDAVELDWLRDTAAWLFPGCGALTGETVAWTGTTTQAVPADAATTESSSAWPVVIDHAEQNPSLQGVLSVFPGRATLWSSIAEETARVAAAQLGSDAPVVPSPPWITEGESAALLEPPIGPERIEIFHCQRCGRVQRRLPGLQPPVCCEAAMTRAAEEWLPRPSAEGLPAVHQSPS